MIGFSSEHFDEDFSIFDGEGVFFLTNKKEIF